MYFQTKSPAVILRAVTYLCPKISDAVHHRLEALARNKKMKQGDKVREYLN